MNAPVLFLTLAGLFFAGLLADMLGRRTRLPRVTLLLALGVLVGRSGFDLLPQAVDGWYDFLSITALTMVAFLLGGTLTRSNLARHGRIILSVSVSIVLLTWASVWGGLLLIGVDPVLAVLLGAIATATAPAATLDVLRQTGVRNTFTETLEGIVAIDDAWGLIVFSLALALAGMIQGAETTEAVLHAAWEMGGAVLLGCAIGLPAAYLTGRVSEGDPLRTEALGIVFLTAGASMLAGVSFLIAGMMAGALIVNLARHHDRAFHEIEHFQWPFMLLFFVLAGASLELTHLSSLGLTGLAYVILRIVSRIVGARIGAGIAGANPTEAKYFGVALLPQAGVAVGMALIAAETFPSIGQAVLTLTIATTIAFEILGPFATMWAVRQVEQKRHSHSA